MKILYCILPLLIAIASPSFVQNYTSLLEQNQFNTYKQVQYKSRRQRKRKPHRGSGRRYLYKIDEVSNS